MSLSMFLFSFVLAFNSQGTKQGDIPFIVINPDTLVTESSSSLISDISSDMEEIINLEGGHFGLGVIDFLSGEKLIKSEGGVFNIGLPNFVTATCAIDLASTEIFSSLDSLVSRNLQWWQLLRRAQCGGMESSQGIIFVLGICRIDDWIESKNLSETVINGVQLFWEDAPDVNPNITTVENSLDMLEILAAEIDRPKVRRILSNPLDGTIIEDLQGDQGFIFYGFSSVAMEGSSRAIIAVGPSGEKLGIVVLADELCCDEKADLAFGMLWQAITENL